MLLKNKSTNPETLTFIDRVQHNIPAFLAGRHLPPNRQLTGPIERLDEKLKFTLFVLPRGFERSGRWFGRLARPSLHRSTIHTAVLGVLKLYVGLLYCLQRVRGYNGTFANNRFQRRMDCHY